MKKIITSLIFCCSCSLAQATDSYTLELYELYCDACHGVKSSGAPQALNPKDWQPYVKQGMSKLVRNAISGMGNMPAMGTCNECGPEELEDLIIYMSQGE